MTRAIQYTRLGRCERSTSRTVGDFVGGGVGPGTGGGVGGGVVGSGCGGESERKSANGCFGGGVVRREAKRDGESSSRFFPSRNVLSALSVYTPLHGARYSSLTVGDAVGSLVGDCARTSGRASSDAAAKAAGGQKRSQMQRKMGAKNRAGKEGRHQYQTKYSQTTGRGWAIATGSGWEIATGSGWATSSGCRWGAASESTWARAWSATAGSTVAYDEAKIKFRLRGVRVHFSLLPPSEPAASKSPDPLE